MYLFIIYGYLVNPPFGALFYVFNLKLTTLGVNPAAIGFATLTMESEKFICVREQATSPDGKSQIVIVDLQNPAALTRRPITADSAVMNPTLNILALKGKH